MKYNNAHIKADNIGDMRHRLSLRTFTTSRNAAGEELRSWGELAEVWGAVEHKTGGSGEGEQGAQTVGQTSVLFRIRHRTDLNEKMIIVWNSKAWNIRSLLPDYDKTYLVIEAEHYVGNVNEILAAPVDDLGNVLIDDSGDVLIDDSGDKLIADIE
jgi:SPP1 family predicted phage head-tail adaptor